MHKLTRWKDIANSSFYLIFGSVAGQCRGGFFTHNFSRPRATPNNDNQCRAQRKCQQMPFLFT